ncbi:MAG: MATE family efflux transporter [Dorea sp.]
MLFRNISKTQQHTDISVNWKHFYKHVFSLIIPMALQNLINVGVTATDVLMLGRVGEKVLSGSSLAGQIQFIMTLFLFGITSGATVLTAQYWGKKDTRSIEKIMGMGMTAAVAAGLAFTVAAELFPEQLLRIFTTDTEVIAEGVKYIRIVAVSYVLMCITQIYLNIMRSIERVLIATVVYAISLIINIILNAILIFGLFGFPTLGIRGAAIATLTSRIFEVAIVVWYAKRKNKVIRFRITDMVKIDKVLFKDFLTYAAPVIVNELLWGLGTSTNTAIIGHLGSAAVAANSVAQVARQMAMVVCFGVSNATAIYLGKTIGEKRYELAKVYGRRFLQLSVITGLAGGCMILIASPIVLKLMTLSAEAQIYMKFMFFVMSYFTLCMSINTTLIVGVLRSGGDTKYGLVVDLGGMWCFSIILGAIAAFKFKASVQVVYAILMCDEVVKLPMSTSRFFSYKWIKNLTRENEELEVE